MNTEIINRVAKSNLITIDLSDYYPKGKRAVIDIKNWLKAVSYTHLRAHET